ncbi:hypothetical protein BUALT_Bualt07G0149400 [Buddleja alternifolia]|uniref:SAWADEE domain-containing protein n=1 Tax=Buddleja alternifolia TaxID=168488 RepID=A0AAV6XBV1_9LAMI|nr:hypothetical protein BUALT_Bualt07G0149400 [Buddleja alternifolia]
MGTGHPNSLFHILHIFLIIQVQSWFQDKITNLALKGIPSSADEGTVASETAIIKKREKVPTISVSEAAVELQNLRFEARSAKDYAWFDVGSFLNYRVLSSGEVVVRVRFAGFGKDEDEWVSVKRAVRERSIPLEPEECDKVNVGDLVLCFREAENHALYGDAYIVEIERKLHDSNGCTCIFVVRYDFDNIEVLNLDFSLLWQGYSRQNLLQASTVGIHTKRGYENGAMGARWNVEGAVAV